MSIASTVRDRLFDADKGGLLRAGARALLGPSDYDEVHVAWQLLRGTPAVMVDVGAHHGGALLGFAQEGWSVFGFEPDPKNREVLLSTTRRLPNVSVDERAISAIDGDSVSFFTSDVSTGISSMAAFHPSHSATATVQTVRLDSFLAEHGEPQVTFLKTDTEGFDLPVLQTFPWDRQRPRVVVCEFEDRKTKPLGYDYDDLGEFLIGQGYAVLVSEWFPIVEYGTRHRWRGVRRYPGPLTSPLGWGNFIAVEPELERQALNVAIRTGHRLSARRKVEHILRRGNNAP